MTEAGVAAPPAAAGRTDLRPLVALATVLVAGGGLALTARLGATPLLVAVAVVQAAAAIAWLVGTTVPGLRGGFVVAALAAGGADVAVSLFPHGRLGALLIVIGLALPVLFAHQLLRGAARVHITGSLSALALLVFALVALTALMQTRHEFATTGTAHIGGTVAAAAAAIPGAALLVGELVDMVLAAPRFDRRVRRGLPALVAAGAVGAAVGYLLLRSTAGFGAAPGAFLGAALGVLAGLLAVATAFVEFTTPARTGLRRALRTIGAALVPLCLLAPVSFLLCLAVRR